MSIDRSDVDEDERANSHRLVTRSAEQIPDSPQARRAVEATRTTDTAKEAPRLPTRDEQIQAHRRARETADAVYAAWNHKGEDEAGTEVKPDDSSHPATVAPAPESRDRAHADDSRPTQPLDKVSATEEALRKRVDELETDNAARDRQLAAQDAKLAAQAKIIAEQGERFDRLEAYVGQITTAVRELRQTRDDPHPSTDIAGRARGGETERAEWKEPQHKRRLPTDAVNNVVSIAAGGVIGDLAYHLRDLPPEAAGIATSGVAFGAGMIAVWRERRKGKDDADNRPKG